MACDDLRIGGTLSGSGITGGVSISDTRIAVADWSGIFGHVAISRQAVGVTGRPGVTLVGDALPLERVITLPLLITRWNQTTKYGLTEPTFGEQLWRNTDLLLGYLADPDGFYLETDDPDGTTRFVLGYALSAVPIGQTSWRRLTVPILCPYPYWRLGGTQQSVFGSGAGTVTIVGNVNVYDAVLVFAGDGTYTNSTAAWSITITGSSSAVTVDLGARTVKQAGVDADNLMSRTDREWGFFVPGLNTLARSVSVTTTLRDQFE